MRRWSILASLAIASLLPILFVTVDPARAASDGTRKVAVFQFELLDTSTEDSTRKPDAEHRKRLEMITRILREAIAMKDGYAVVDTAPVREERVKMPSFTGCGGCALKLGGKLDADLVVTGFVHKISLLIIDMAVAVRDVKTGKLVEHDAVSIRGDTDKSWEEGMRFLVRDRLFKDETK